MFNLTYYIIKLCYNYTHVFYRIIKARTHNKSKSRIFFRKFCFFSRIFIVIKTTFSPFCLKIPSETRPTYQIFTLHILPIHSRTKLDFTYWLPKVMLLHCQLASRLSLPISFLVSFLP